VLNFISKFVFPLFYLYYCYFILLLFTSKAIVVKINPNILEWEAVWNNLTAFVVHLAITGVSSLWMREVKCFFLGYSVINC
jgi:hypothetical protein